MSAADLSSSSTPEAAGNVQADSPAAEAGVGEGEGGAGEGQQGSHEEEVVEGGSGAGVPVIEPAPVYNKEGVVVEVTQDIVDAVDKFTPPAGFVRKGSRDKSYMHSVGVYVEHTESRRTDHKYYCLAHSKCRRSSKVIPCKRGDRSNVNTHLKTAHNMQVSGLEAKGGPKGGPQNTIMPVTRKTSFMFKCGEEDGDVRIEAFIQKTFDWYCKGVESTEDHFRYLYSLVLTDPPSTFPGGMVGIEQPIGKRSYKRFQLSDAKDFSSLFFPEKDAILRLLEHFENKTGKYAIKGYPHKLGLLLHGPPGTGKTSLIKALACRTGRNVVSVPLTRIRTNQELMDIVFDQKFQVVGEGGLPVSLGFRDVIFVMEDVDVTSPIVKSRDPFRRKRGTATTLKEVRPLVAVAQTPATVAAAPESGSGLHLGPRCLLEQPVQLTRSTSHPVEGRPMKSGAALKTAPLPIRLTTVGSSDSNVIDDGDEESSHPPRNSHNKITSGNGDGGCSVNHPTSPERVCGLEGRQAGSGSRTSDTKVAPIMPCSGTSSHSDGSTDGSADETSMRYVTGGCRRGDARGTKKGPIYGSFASTVDNLDLAGLLNVLDGVVDTPGRIVVMTTNYPEALDAALIRPGRIDKIIYLGHMRYPAALEMTLHYFQVDKLEPAQDKRLRKVFGESLGPEGGGSAQGDSHGGCRDTGKGFYDRFTPATVEQMASEHETVDEFLSALEAQALLLASCP